MSTGDVDPNSISTDYSPVYWGCIVSTALVGTTLVQGSTYFSRSSDPWMLRSLVSLTLILDTLDSVLMAYTIYYLFVMNLGNLEVFMVTSMSWMAENLVAAVVTFIVQVFFASRIYLVTSEYVFFHSWRKIIPAFIVVTALVSLASATAVTILLMKGYISVISSTTIEVMRCLEEGLAALSDILATFTLCIVLASGNSRRGQSPLRRLFFFTLTRGILVTVVQIGTLAAYLAATLRLYWMPFHLCKSKIYTSTLLYMLNSRGETPSVLPTVQFRPSLFATPQLTDGVGSTSRPLSAVMVLRREPTLEAGTSDGSEVLGSDGCK